MPVLSAEYSEFGPPEQVLRIVQHDDLSLAPGGLVRVRMLMAPVNPADLNKIEGKYGIKPPLPAVAGIEGVGEILEGGESTGLSPGTRVLLPADVGTWRSELITTGDQLIALPDGVPLEEAAILSVNPCTAYLMLREFVALQPGEWVIQNAANSNVGLCAVQIAKAQGLKTLNVVRRSEAAEMLRSYGAEHVFLDHEEELIPSVKAMTGSQRPRLALNAVGGESALRLANCLASGGVHVTYGAMGRVPTKIPAGLLIFKDITFRGFWVTRWKEQASRQAVQEMINELAGMARMGQLNSEVEKIYPLDEITAAVRHASQSQRRGKILLDLRAMP